MNKISILMVLIFTTRGFAQTIQLLPGRYKVKTTATMIGPAEETTAEIKKQISSLPKDVQAEALKQLSNIKPSVHTQESEQCLTKADLDPDSFVKSINQNKDCQVSTVKKTAKVFQTKVSCANEGQTNLTITLVDKTSYKYKGEGMNKGAVVTQFHGTGSWVAKTCSTK